MAYDIEHFVYDKFVDVMQYGNPVSDLRVDCPFCSDRYGKDDYKKHLYVSLEKQLVHCFRCGYSRNWVGFVMDMTGYPYIRALAELYKAPNARELDNVLSKKRKDIIGTEVYLPDDFVPLISTDAKSYKKYLLGRGFDKTYWKHYNLGIAQSQIHRVIIPIEDGYWQGRAIYKWIEPKYLNPKSESSHYIFNSIALDLYDEVVICEGAFSAMAVGRNAVALVGKESPDEKLKRFINSDVSKFIIALEPNAFGTVQKLTDSLIRADKTVVIWKYNQGDPADSIDYEVIDYTFKNSIYMKLYNNV